MEKRFMESQQPCQGFFDKRCNLDKVTEGNKKGENHFRFSPFTANS
jgi:hypothetical protein